MSFDIAWKSKTDSFIPFLAPWNAYKLFVAKILIVCMFFHFKIFIKKIYLVSDEDLKFHSTFACKIHLFYLATRSPSWDKFILRRHMHCCDHAYPSCRTKGYAGKRGAQRGEEKARERRKAHRRLTRIYGFVGLANKESARETGFAGRHSPPRAQTESLHRRLLPLRARKHWIHRHFGYRGPRQRSARAANLWPRSASRAGGIRAR